MSLLIHNSFEMIHVFDMLNFILFYFLKKGKNNKEKENTERKEKKTQKGKEGEEKKAINEEKRRFISHQ